MKKSTVLFSALLLIGICILTAIVAVWATSIPQRAKILYGSPIPGMSFAQEFRISWALLNTVDDLNTPADIDGYSQVFTISTGESTASIIDRLYTAQFISNPESFRNYLIYTGIDTQLKPGDYQLSQAMTAIEIAKTLQNIEATGVTFTILAGWRLEEIAASLPSSGLVNIDPADFLVHGWRAPTGQLASQWPSESGHEGLLFPDSYLLPRDTTLEGLYGILLENFQQQVSGDVLAGFGTQGLSLHEGVTIASIVQREAVVDSEKPLIASVFLNRYWAGIKLDADPTVQYAIGLTAEHGWWKAPLFLSDLEIESPYNTYKNIGLPPGPIANPGLSALMAVAFPEESPYIYFRAKCDGSGEHFFAVTFEEHQANGCE
jgi:UPF0755 protein